MAKAIKSKVAKKVRRDEALPFERINYIIFGIGLLFIVVGYIALSGNSVDGFVPLTIAPLLLVIGYCVIIPVAIMYRKKTPAQPAPTQAPTEAQPQP